MSDQARGGGHPLITAEATSHIYQKLAVAGKFLGLSEEKFFQKVNEGQAFADRSLLGFIENTPTSVGNTWMPYWMAPGAQVQHSMADTSLTGGENLRAVRDFVTGCLNKAHAAHVAGDSSEEFRYLGAAVHAIEDSYSSAHVFRDPAHPGDPHASIQAFNTFNWYGDSDTHEEVFDSVPSLGNDLARDADKAAALAMTEMFGTYAKSLVQHSADASAAYSALARELYHGTDIKVFTNTSDPDYQSQRDAHFRNEASGLGDGAPGHQTTTHDGVSGSNAGIDGAAATPPDGPMSTTPDVPISFAGALDVSSPAKAGDVRPESTSPDARYAHPTGGVEDSIKHTSHNKTYEIWGRDPKEHAADKSFHSWEHLNGKDILCPVGTPIYAVDDGVVAGGFGKSKSENAQLQGLRLHIEAEDNTFFYGHLSRLAPGIELGAPVTKGQLIGYSGTAGGVPHLHFAAEKSDTTMRVLNESAPHVDGSTHGHQSGPLSEGKADAAQLHVAGASESAGRTNELATGGMGLPGATPASEGIHPGGMRLPEDGSGYQYFAAGGMSLPDDGGGGQPHGRMSLPDDGIGVLPHGGGMSLPDNGGTSQSDHNGVISGLHHESPNPVDHNLAGSLPHTPMSLPADVGGGLPHGGMSLPDDVAGGSLHSGMSLPDDDGNRGLPHHGGMSLPDDGASSGAPHLGGMSLPDHGTGAVPHDVGGSGAAPHSDASGMASHLDDGSNTPHQ